MEEESTSTKNRKKPQFGNRYLTDPGDVYQHNAWDDMEWTEELERNAEEKVNSNSLQLVEPDAQEKYEAEANLFWDKFYNIHQNRFFKDRHWLFTEFPELSLKLNSKGLAEQEANTLRTETLNDDELKQTNCQKLCIWEVGCGAGNTVFPILEENVGSDVYVYCCDFSEVAVSLVKNHPAFDADHCHPFVCNISDEEWSVPFEEASLDFIILIFVLSAIHPKKMQSIICKMAKYLKIGGQILFRDYGRYDMVELRFKPGQCLTDHFYVRGDGTRVYFFTEEGVHELFSKAGLVKSQNFSSRRLQVNRGKLIKMYRIWIQAKYTKV